MTVNEQVCGACVYFRRFSTGGPAYAHKGDCTVIVPTWVFLLQVTYLKGSLYVRNDKDDATCCKCYVPLVL